MTSEQNEKTTDGGNSKWPGKTPVVLGIFTSIIAILAWFGVSNLHQLGRHLPQWLADALPFYAEALPPEYAVTFPDSFTVGISTFTLNGGVDTWASGDTDLGVEGQHDYVIADYDCHDSRDKDWEYKQQSNVLDVEVRAFKTPQDAQKVYPDLESSEKSDSNRGAELEISYTAVTGRYLVDDEVDERAMTFCGASSRSAISSGIVPAILHQFPSS